MFWESRIDKTGSFAPYYENLLAFAAVPGCDCAGACNRTHWSFLGPDSLPTQNMGAITSVWVNPSDPQNILAGTYSAGLYRTTNGGADWSRITQSGCKGDCPGFPHGGVTSIAVDPKNTNVIYISLGINRGLTPEQYSYGVYKSTDGGNRWCPTDLQFTPTDFVGSTKVVMDPADSNTLFAIAGNMVYKTTNAGATWKANANVIYTTPNGHEIHDIAVSRNPGSAGLFISEAGDRCFQDNGCPPSNSTWNCPLTDGQIWYNPDFKGLVMNDITVEALGFIPDPGKEVRFEKGLFSVTPNSVNILALSEKHACPLGQTADRIIARNSTNSSPIQPGSWIQHDDPPGAQNSHGSGYASAFAVSPVNDSLVMIGSDHGNPSLPDLFVSNTGGTDFTLNKDCLHADLRALAFAGNVSTGDEFWIVGNDGGVAKATINATNKTGPCQNLNGSGLTVTDFFGISNSEVDPSKIYGGAQDNGAFNTTAAGWHMFNVGDGYDVVADVTDPAKAYIPTNNNGFYYTTDGGNTWGSPPFLPPGEAHLPNMPMVIDKSNALYIAQQNVWRVYSSATAATQLSNWNPSTDGVLRALHVPALNSSTIITAKNGFNGKLADKIFRTDGANFNSPPSAWPSITYNLPVHWQLITSITSDEKGENVWVGMGNFGPHVFLLEKESTKWKDVSQGLPNLPVNVIRYWEGSGDDSLFVGTDTGVYYRNKNLSEWKRISCGLPNILVSDLEINNRTQKVRIATRGGGVWETSLSSIKNQGCSSDSYLAASYTSASGPVNRELLNNALVTDALRSPISLTPKRVCCVEPCDIVSNYAWKVYSVQSPAGIPILIGAGQNSPVTFTPIYVVGHIRFSYRVEVTGSCKDKTCAALTVQFHGR